MNKREKGITLVALVITIIVLIILAGVSINAVLNGGLIKNAKDARNEFDKGKRNEVESLSTLKGYITDLEDEKVRADFAKESIPAIFKNSYLTGIEPDKKVADISLPENYVLCNIDGSDIADTATTKVTTGMVIKKNGVEVGRVVIYGDVGASNSGTPDGSIGGSDVQIIAQFINLNRNKEDYIKVAMDVTHDGIINLDDFNLVSDVVTDMHMSGIKQDAQAGDVDIFIVENTTASEKYRKNFPIGDYNFTWSEYYDFYLLQGVTIGETTVGDLTELFPEGTVIADEYGNIKNSNQKIAEWDIIYLNNVYIGYDNLYEVGCVQGE